MTRPLARQGHGRRRRRRVGDLAEAHPQRVTKLSDHVGHTVEVSGTIGDKAAGAAARSDPAAARPSASAQTALNVRNVRMVSATCTP